jgi:hypothetical protein
MENNDQFTNEIAPVKRTGLLTTACILTWVMCAFTFLSTTMSLLSSTPEKQAESIEQMRQFNPGAAEKMEEAYAKQTMGMQVANTLINLVGVALSAFGAWMMWNLKKKGFFLYLGGELLPYLGFIFAGDLIAASFAAFGIDPAAIIGALITVMLIFDAVFIIFYAVNLKHMK